MFGNNGSLSASLRLPLPVLANGALNLGEGDSLPFSIRPSWGVMPKAVPKHMDDGGGVDGPRVTGSLHIGHVRCRSVSQGVMHPAWKAWRQGKLRSWTREAKGGGVGGGGMRRALLFSTAGYIVATLQEVETFEGASFPGLFFLQSVKGFASAGLKDCNSGCLCGPCNMFFWVVVFRKAANTTLIEFYSMFYCNRRFVHLTYFKNSKITGNCYSKPLTGQKTLYYSVQLQ